MKTVIHIYSGLLLFGAGFMAANELYIVATMWVMTASLNLVPVQWWRWLATDGFKFSKSPTYTVPNGVSRIVIYGGGGSGGVCEHRRLILPPAVECPRCAYCGEVFDE